MLAMFAAMASGLSASVSSSVLWILVARFCSGFFFGELMEREVFPRSAVSSSKWVSFPTLPCTGGTTLISYLLCSELVGEEWHAFVSAGCSVSVAG